MAKNYKTQRNPSEPPTTKFKDLNDYALNQDTERKLENGMAKVAHEVQPSSSGQKIDEGGSSIVTARRQTMPTKGVAVRMPEDIYKRTLMFKFTTGMTIQDIIIAATIEWLDRHENK